MVELKKKGSLGYILSTSRIITEADIQAALEEQAHSGCRLGEALVKLGLISQEDVDWALSNQLDIPYIRLKRELIDPAAIGLIPADMARRFACIPLFQAGDELNIALADPVNRFAIESVELQTGLRVSISVAVLGEIMAMIDECYGPVRHDTLGFESAAFSCTVLEVINADLSGAKLLDGLLITILKNQLTSLSLQPCGNRVVIRGRRAGLSREVGTITLNRYPDFVRKLRERASIPSDAQLTSKGCFGFEYRNQSFDFHVALMQASEGEFITLNLEVPERIPERISDLDLAEEQLAAFGLLAQAKRGITFFASHSILERNRFMGLMLKEAVTEGKNVMVLGDGSDWVRNRFPCVPLPGNTTERVRLIMASLDHDPDILVIEELGEGPLLSAACRAALRGVRVLAGLDVRGTGGVLRHLQCQKQCNPSLPLLVHGLISLKSVRSLCPACRTEETPTPEELAAMGLEQIPDVFYRSSGCDACGDSGFRERRILLDVLPFDDELRQLFRKNADAAAFEGYIARNCHGVAREGLRLLFKGELSPEEYIASVIM
jgi:type IV pilus assembly protein PilB